MIRDNNHIEDTQGRTFKTLRVSLTEICNLGCTYCTDDNDKHLSRDSEKRFSNPDKITEAIKSIHALTPLTSIRLTGGEPLLYPGLEQLITNIKRLGIGRLKMTTNASLMGKKATELKAAGLDEVNISLDALDEETYHKVTRRRNINRVIEGILAAKAAGLDIKLNAVIMKGINDNQLMPLLEFARKHDLIIRFLEVMEMGYMYNQFEKRLFPMQAMLSRINKKYSFSSIGRKPGNTAHYWEMLDGFRFGIIANTSAPFCSDCNRLRLDSNGKLFGCLSNNNGIDIQNDINNYDKMRRHLETALAQKQKTHFTGSSLSMKSIGG